jgi:hypothetical protein
VAQRLVHTFQFAQGVLLATGGVGVLADGVEHAHLVRDDSQPVAGVKEQFVAPVYHRKNVASVCS